MNPSPGHAPMTMDAQQVDKVEAADGEVEVTSTAMPRDSDGPSGQVQIRFDLDTTRALATRLNATHRATRVRWYIDTLGFRPSDVMCLPDGTPVGAFMRLDRGKEPTDHHTLFLATGLEPKDL
jgi:hypothetical protein